MAEMEDESELREELQMGGKIRPLGLTVQMVVFTSKLGKLVYRMSGSWVPKQEQDDNVFCLQYNFFAQPSGKS